MQLSDRGQVKHERYHASRAWADVPAGVFAGSGERQVKSASAGCGADTMGIAWLPVEKKSADSAAVARNHVAGNEAARHQTCGQSP